MQGARGKFPELGYGESAGEQPGCGNLQSRSARRRTASIACRRMHWCGGAFVVPRPELLPADARWSRRESHRAV